MRLEDIFKILRPIQNKIFLLIGRGVVKEITNGTEPNSIQLIKAEYLKDEILSKLENFQEYGLESYVEVGTAEVVTGFLNGNRGHGIIIKVSDRNNRIKDLVEKEVALYTSNDDGKTGTPSAGGKHRIHMKADGSIEIEILTGKTVKIAGDADFAVRFTELETGFNQFLTDYNDQQAKYNLHTHLDPVSGSTGIPSNTGSVSAADISGAKVEEVKLP